MKIVAVVHEEKESLRDLVEQMRAAGKSEKEIARIGSNPPLTMEGFVRAHRLIPILEPLKPFSEVISSPLTRTIQMASVFGLAFGIPVRTEEALCQYASREGDEVFFYPGHDNEWYERWQRQAVELLQNLVGGLELNPENFQILVTHRPIVAALICAHKGISDVQRMRELALSGEIPPGSVFVFNVSRREGEITSYRRLEGTEE